MHTRMEVGFTLIVLLLSTVSSGQTGVQFRTVVINDQSGKVAAMEVGNKTYIDLERLVQIGHGAVEHRGNQIIVSLSCIAPTAPTEQAQAEQSISVRLSREFMKAGIEEISLLREWASSLANAIQNGYPISDNWVAAYRAKAQTGLGVVSAKVSTEGDRSGAQLLKDEFDAVQEWSNKLMEARKSMDAAKYALSPGALQSDPLSQRIVSCGRFLGQMLANGDFQDDASCH